MSVHNPKVSAINFSASGDNTVVTGVTNLAIKVHGIFFTVGGATNITFKDGASTSLSAAVVFTGSGSSQTLQINDEAYFVTTPGNNFVMNSSSAVQVSGTIYYTVG